MRKHFNDTQKLVHVNSSDVEIDVFSPELLVIAEVTYKVKNLEKLKKFIRKKELLERTIFNRKSESFFCSLEIDQQIYAEFINLANSAQVQVITKEIRYLD